MTGFFSRILVTGRKAHRCEHCRRSIPAGTRHGKIAHKLDGDFESYREHIECREAWIALRVRRELCHDEPTPFLCADDGLFDDRDWLETTFPIVARRLWPVRIVTPAPTPAERAAAFRDSLFPSYRPGGRP